jgi:hypothetical protein
MGERRQQILVAAWPLLKRMEPETFAIAREVDKT